VSGEKVLGDWGGTLERKPEMWGNRGGGCNSVGAGRKRGGSGVGTNPHNLVTVTRESIEGKGLDGRLTQGGGGENTQRGKEEGGDRMIG